MSVHPTSESPNFETLDSHSEELHEAPLAEDPLAEAPLAEDRPAAAGEPACNPFEGTWIGPSTFREFPDRIVGRRQAAYAPAQPANEGWLWRDRIRSGDLVVVVGEGASGKSTVMADWIARVTTGTPFPDCEEGEALPPSDVLLFNAAEDFPRSVIPRIEAVGGDVERVFRANDSLLRMQPEDGFHPARYSWSNLACPRVPLQKEVLRTRLLTYLIHRPSIRLVVIDQANLHLRCPSERQFEEVVVQLLDIARVCEVAMVITMQPDAFRRGEGVARYLQSRSLKENANSIWRVAVPTDPEVPGRVLECLKISYGVADSGKQNWHILQRPDQTLEWNRASGTVLAPGKDLVKHRNLVRVWEFLDQSLFVLGGITGWETLAERAARHGIAVPLLREAVTYWNLGTLFEPHGDDVRELVGWAEQIVAKREQIRALQALDREAYKAGRSPVLVDPAETMSAESGSNLPSANSEETMPEETMAEERVTAAISSLATRNVPTGRRLAATTGVSPGSANFNKPEFVSGGDREGVADLEGVNAPRSGVKGVTQAG